MNTFLPPQSQPSAPLMASPPPVNTANPMQQLAAMMQPQQSFGGGGMGQQFGLAQLMQMMKSQGTPGAPAAPPIAGSGQAMAAPGPGTGGLY